VAIRGGFRSRDQAENSPRRGSRRETNYEQRFPQEWLDALAALETDWHKEFLEIAPWLIVVFRIDYGIARDGGGTERKIKHYYVQESVGIACGFLIVALHNMGLATVTHTPSPMGFLSQVLGRPANGKPFLLLPVGFPAEDAEVPDIKKKPLSESAIFMGITSSRVMGHFHLVHL